MDPGGAGGGSCPGPGVLIASAATGSSSSLAIDVVTSNDRQNLQLVDSESSDSGFHDALEVQPNELSGNLVTEVSRVLGDVAEIMPTETGVSAQPETNGEDANSVQDIEEVSSEPTSIQSDSVPLQPVEDAHEGESLLSMLFRRSTMRRSMRPVIFSSSVQTFDVIPDSPQTEASVPIACNDVDVEALVDEMTKVPLESTVTLSSDVPTRRSAQRRNVQFAIGEMSPPPATTTTTATYSSSEETSPSASSAIAGVTVDTILVTIPEHQILVSTSSSPNSQSTLETSSSDSQQHQQPPSSVQTTARTQSLSTGDSISGGRLILTGAGNESSEDREARVGGYWSHSSSSFLASLSCTVGMFDICRFSYLSFQYGGNFILQFLMLTVIFGIPMLSFQMAAGQYMGAGIVNMWKASPVFQGVGISAIFALSLIGVYSVVPVTWMFIYFRDSFVATTTFRWGECRNFMAVEECLRSELNATEIFKRAIPAYFQNKVLKSRVSGNTLPGQSPDLIFENVFNLAVIWIIVFICLSKGSKSYGRVIVAFSLCPLVCFYLVAIEILRRGSTGTEQIMSLNTDFNAFFLNGWSWLAAAREVFFIWGINGAVLMQIASHNKLKHNIKRDCTLIVLVTLSVILLSAFLTCSCIYIIYKTQRFSQRFVPSSYEMLEYSQFLVPAGQAAKMTSDLDKYMSTNYLLGVESTTQKMDTTRASGYQVARLATEIFPMALVQLGPHRISAFWPVLFYLALIAFGIAQQLAIWRCVIEGFIAIRPKKLRRWETSITFFSCIFGFVFGLPFTAEGGAFAIHFMDVCVGCIWWLALVFLAQIVALVLVRGRPYTSEDIVTVFADTPLMKAWLAPLMSFSWNVLLPVTLMVLSIASFKLGDFGRMFSFEDGIGYIYWPSWVKQFGALIQIVPILIIPLVSLVQASRYLGPNEQPFATRLDNFLRPALSFAPRGEAVGPTGIFGASVAISTSTATETIPDDPPPKYTPPPSYNTATGLKILKRLNSLRRSFRRSQRGRASTSGGGNANNNNNSDVEMQHSASNNTVVNMDVPPSYVTVVESGVGMHATTSPNPAPATTTLTELP